MPRSFDEVIFEIDNDPAVWKYTFSDGLSMWLAVRFNLRFINLGKVSGHGTESAENGSPGKWQLIRYLLHTAWKSPLWNLTRVDILSFANYEGKEEVPNWWTFFLKHLPEFKKRELLYSHKLWAFGNIPATYSCDYFYYRSLVFHKIHAYFKKGKRNHAHSEFMVYLRLKLGAYLSENDFGQIASLTSHIESIGPWYRRILTRYLRFVKPRLIVSSEGNNGDWKYNILFSVAHALKVPTVEVQHGGLGLGMVYGNELVKESFFKKQKSDYLFTFGDYHNGMSNAAGENISFGHYRLETEKKKLLPNRSKEGEPIRILFVCEGIPASAENNGLIRSAEEALRNYNGDYELVIRLHPTEVPGPRYEGLMGLRNARYSSYQTENIYQLVSDADIVLGHISTVMFEALYFEVTPWIFRDETSLRYMPINLGEWFSNGDDLKQMLENFSRAKRAPEKQIFWEENGVLDNFRSFWENRIQAGIRKELQF